MKKVVKWHKFRNELCNFTKKIAMHDFWQENDRKWNERKIWELTVCIHVFCLGQRLPQFNIIFLNIWAVQCFCYLWSAIATKRSKTRLKSLSCEIMTLQQTTKLQTYEAARSCMQPKNPTIGSGYIRHNWWLSCYKVFQGKVW